MTEAGPSSASGPGSTSTRPIRKPKAPHPFREADKLGKRVKLPPPLPPKPGASSHPSASVNPRAKPPTLPLKTSQGVSKTRTDGTKDGFGREIIFVTRKTGLGTLMGRCRSLVVDEGYTKLTLHALGAAIPQALVLLHALLDLLPYPVGEKGMWYEIHTGSVECVDEVQPATQAGEGEDPEMAWLKDVGAVEAKAPKRQSRIKSSITIDLHVSPKPKRSGTNTEEGEVKKRKAGTRNRPSKKRRQVLARKRGDLALDGDAHDGEGEDEAMNVVKRASADDGDEEDMMNVQYHQSQSGMTVSEEEEEIEEIEEK